MSRPRLDPRTPLSELHVHLGAAVTPGDHVGHRARPGDPPADQGLLGLPRPDHGRAPAPRIRRLPRPLPLDRADPVEPDRGRAQRLRGHRRRLSAQQRDQGGAALQPDEAEPRRRAGPRPHHRRRGARHGPGRARVSAGPGRPHLLPRSRLLARAQRDHRGQGHRLAEPRAWSASTSPDRQSTGFRFADYAAIYAECRRAGLGLTVHAGETGGADEVREAHRGPRAGSHRPWRARADDASVLATAARAGHRARGLPVVEPEHARPAQPRGHQARPARDGRATGCASPSAPTGPEMLRTYLRDELEPAAAPRDPLARRRSSGPSTRAPRRASSTARRSSRARSPGANRAGNGHAAIRVEAVT